MQHKVIFQRIFWAILFASFLFASVRTWLMNDAIRGQSNRLRTSFTGDKLAVIVPYRDVFGELQIFIPHMEQFLNNQSIQHEFLVIRQADSFRFNKGALINIGYLMSRDRCNYLAIHDIDTIPLNPEVNYRVPSEGPRLLSPREYHPVYNGSRFSGGIVLITMDEYKKVGGMTNEYWGWGGEDNEFYSRMQKNKLKISKTENLSTNKSNTFRNIHDLTKRPRDRERFDAVKKSVFKVDTNSGYFNVQYDLDSKVDMTISGVSFAVYNVALHCGAGEKWCR